MENSIPVNIELPQNINNNYTVLIYETNEGWGAYDFITYYFLDENGAMIQYKEERPKTYLKNKNLERKLVLKEINEEQIEKIKRIIKSEQLSKLLNFNQEDFKVKIGGNIPPPCYIYDALGYKLTIIQQNRMKSYHYYAPKHYLERCPDKTINKKVLQNFVDVLELFWN